MKLRIRLYFTKHLTDPIKFPYCVLEGNVHQGNTFRILIHLRYVMLLPDEGIPDSLVIELEPFHLILQRILCVTGPVHP